MLTAAHCEWFILICGIGAAAASGYVLGEIIGHLRAFQAAAREELVVVEATSPLIRAFLPLARRLGIGLRLLLARDRREAAYNLLADAVDRKLASAGRPQGLNSDEYMGFAVLLTFPGGVAGIFLYLLLEPAAVFSIYAYFGAGVLLALFLWRSWLERKREEWQASIRKTLPFALDLLTLSMEAGLDFTSALARMCKKIGHTPLGREFALMLHEIQLGKTRSQALRDFSRRINVTEVGSVVASLVQAEELGSSLGPILRIQAAQQRERRAQRAEEMAMKAPVKILAPLVLCFFTTILIILGGPIAMQVFSALRGE